MLSNLNTLLDENPLIPLFNSLIQHSKHNQARFGSMRLNSSQFNLSDAAQESFGKRFEPEMLKFFNTCGSIVQTQGRWWRSGLLYGKLSHSITQNSGLLANNCPWPFIYLYVTVSNCSRKSAWLQNIHVWQLILMCGAYFRTNILLDPAPQWGSRQEGVKMSHGLGIKLQHVCRRCSWSETNKRFNYCTLRHTGRLPFEP